MSAHENLRLKVSLTWAVEFVEREIEVMERSFLADNGEWDDEDMRVECANAKQWLIEAREALETKA